MKGLRKMLQDKKYKKEFQRKISIDLDSVLDKKRTDFKPVVARSGVLKGTAFMNLVAKHPLPLSKFDMVYSTADALQHQDLIWLHGEFADFRDMVQSYLVTYAKENGVKEVLRITGLSKAAYYRGINSDSQRADSAFNKYLKNLAGVELVYNQLHQVNSLARKEN